MNAIDLTEHYTLLSIWRLERNKQWKLVDVARPASAIYRCRQDPEGSLYAFSPSYCPANFRGGSIENLMAQKSRKADPKCSKID